MSAARDSARNDAAVPCLSPFRVRGWSFTDAAGGDSVRRAVWCGCPGSNWGGVVSDPDRAGFDVAVLTSTGGPASPPSARLRPRVSACPRRVPGLDLGARTDPRGSGVGGWSCCREMGRLRQESRSKSTHLVARARARGGTRDGHFVEVVREVSHGSTPALRFGCEW